MAGRRICAGYYRRYDGKVIYVVSLATDSDNGEEVVIWTTYPFADVPQYYTSSKKSFCAFVEVSGERRAKYKRLTNMKISEAAIERLEDEGFRGPVRKSRPRQMEEEYDARAYQQAATYHAYAKELCENYNFDLRKYRFCVNQKRYAAITKSDFGKLKEDLCFLDRPFWRTTGITFGNGLWTASPFVSMPLPICSTGAGWITCRRSSSPPSPGC